MTNGPASETRSEKPPDPHAEVDLLRQVSIFRKRFGRPHFELLLHASIPLRLSPELLALLRTNFAGQAPPEAEADILLAPFCRHHGGSLFSLPEEIREYLLLTLETHPRLGRERLLDVSRFLFFFSHDFEAGSEDVLKRHFGDLQRWTSWAYLEPNQAAEGLAQQMSSALAAGDRSELLRTARIASTLSAPFWSQDELLLYSSAVETLSTEGILESGIARDLGGFTNSIQVGSVHLPSPAQLSGALRSEIDLSSEIAEEAAGRQGFELRFRLEGHQGHISDLAFSSDGRLLASVSMKGEVKVWDPGKGSLEFETRFEGASFCANFLPHSSQLLVGLARGGIRRIALAARVPGITTAELATDAGSIVELAVSPDDKTLAAGTMNGQLLLMSPQDGSNFREFPIARGPLNSIAWAPDGSRLIAAADNGALFQWEAESRQKPVEIHRGDSAAASLSWSGNGQVLAVGYDSGVVQIFEVSSLKIERQWRVEGGEIICLAFSGDDQLLAVKSFRGGVSLWRPESGERLASLDEKMKSTKRGGLALSPGESLLATTDDEETAIRLWRLRYNQFLEISNYRYGKIVLLGHNTGEAGKIIQMFHDLSRARSTRGQHLRTLSYRIRGQDEKQETLLWDLSSQQDYPILPRLHLAGSDIVLFLVNPEAAFEESLLEWIHWVNQAATASQLRDPAELEPGREIPVIKFLLVPESKPNKEAISGLSELARQQQMEGPVAIRNRQDLTRLFSQLDDVLFSRFAEPASFKQMSESDTPSGDSAQDPYTPNEILTGTKSCIDVITRERSLISARELRERVVARMPQLADDGFRGAWTSRRLFREQARALWALERTGAIHLLPNEPGPTPHLEAGSPSTSPDPLVLLEPDIRDTYLETIRLKLAGSPEQALALDEVLNWRLGPNAGGRQIRPARDETRFLQAFVSELMQLGIAMPQEDSGTSYLYFPGLSRGAAQRAGEGMALLLASYRNQSIDLETVRKTFEQTSHEAGFQPFVQFTPEKFQVPVDVTLLLVVVDSSTLQEINWEEVAHCLEQGITTALLVEEKMEAPLPLQGHGLFYYPKGSDLEGDFTAAFMLPRQRQPSGKPTADKAPSQEE